MSEIIHLRGTIRRDLAKLRAMAQQTLELLERGAQVEPGPLPIEVESLMRGGELVRRLLVDGRPADDFS